MGFSEIHVHQEEDFIMVIRHHPRTHQSVYLITHTAFQLKPFHIVNRGYPQFQYAGDFKEEIISVFTAPIDVSSFEKQPKYINGVSQFLQIPSIPIVCSFPLLLLLLLFIMKKENNKWNVGSSIGWIIRRRAYSYCSFQ